MYAYVILIGHFKKVIKPLRKQRTTTPIQTV